MGCGGIYRRKLQKTIQEKLDIQKKVFTFGRS
jgi:hypothetical protein